MYMSCFLTGVCKLTSTSELQSSVADATFLPLKITWAWAMLYDHDKSGRGDRNQAYNHEWLRYS